MASAYLDACRWFGEHPESLRSSIQTFLSQIQHSQTYERTYEEIMYRGTVRINAWIRTLEHLKMSSSPEDGREGSRILSSIRIQLVEFLGEEVAKTKPPALKHSKN